MANKRRFYKSAVSGKFVSRVQVRRNPSKTITQTARARRRRA